MSDYNSQTYHKKPDLSGSVISNGSAVKSQASLQKYSDSIIENLFKKQARMFKQDMDLFYQQQADKYVDFQNDIKDALNSEKKEISDGREEVKILKQSWKNEHLQEKELLQQQKRDQKDLLEKEKMEFDEKLAELKKDFEKEKAFILA